LRGEGEDSRPQHHLHRRIECGVEVVGHLQVLCVARFGRFITIRAIAGSGRSSMMVAKSMSPRVFSIISTNVVMPSDDTQGPIPVIPGRCGSIEPGISRFRVQPAGCLGMTFQKSAALAGSFCYVHEKFYREDFDAQVLDRTGGAGDVEPDQLRL
jgi:hypothetical protein